MTMSNFLFCAVLALLIGYVVFVMRRKRMGHVLLNVGSRYSTTVVGVCWIILAIIRTVMLFFKRGGIGSASVLDWTLAILYWPLAIAFLTRHFSTTVFERGISVGVLLLDWGQISGWYLGAPSDGAVSLALEGSGPRNLYLRVHTPLLFFWGSKPINTRVECTSELEVLLNQHLPGMQKLGFGE